MAYFDKNPNHFRVIFSAFTLICLTFAIAANYIYTTSTSDQNSFTHAPSTICFISPLTPAEASLSVKPGDFITRINGVGIESLPDIEKLLSELPDSNLINIDVAGVSPGIGGILKKAKITVKKEALSSDRIQSLPASSALVTWVQEGGVSSRAGMMPGDVIVKLNNCGFTDIYEADSIMRSFRGGQTIEYEVLRQGNHVVKLPITLASFGLGVTHLLSLLTAAAFLTTGAFIGLKRPQFKPARMIGFFMVALGFALSELPDDGIYSQLLFLKIDLRLGMFCVMFGLAALFDSLFFFPRERQEILSKPGWRYALYGTATLGFIVNGFITSNPNRLPYVLTMFIIVSVCLWRYRHQATVEYKQLSRLIILAGLGLVIVRIGLEIFFEDILDLKKFRIQSTNVLFILLPLAYLYTIGRYRLLDMDLRIRRNIQYTVATLALKTAVSVAVVWTLIHLPEVELRIPNVRFIGSAIEISDDPLPLEQRQIYEKIVLMVLALGLTYAYWRLSHWLQSYIDRVFYREGNDYSRAANEISNVINGKMSLEDLSHGLVQKLCEVLRLKTAAISFWTQSDACGCIKTYGLSGTECLSLSPETKAFLQDLRSHLVLDTCISTEYLPGEVKSRLLQFGLRCLIPVQSKNETIGLLMAGEKLSEAPFHQDDLQFLALVATQTAVAVENASLYKKLAGQERFRHELEIARRIQLQSLPQKTPHIEGLEIAGVSIPALEVGGDYYDYLNGVPNEITIIVGDVSGKGTSAALYMSKMQGILHSLHGFGLSPRELFIRANTILSLDLERRSFVTAIGGFFDTRLRRLTLSRAGHLPLYHYRTNTGSITEITPKGMGLAIERSDKFAALLGEVEVPYELGDVFLFATDGITEAPNAAGEEFGELHLTEILKNTAHRCANDIRDDIIQAVRNFAGANVDQHDDLTIVVVKARQESAV